MKSKELKDYNLPSDSYFISEIDAKPTAIFVIFAIIGCIMLFYPDYKMYGLFIVIFSIMAALFMPATVLIEFYNEFLVLYNKADRNMCTIIYYNEVESWTYEKGNFHDFLIIELLDGTKERIEAFSKVTFESKMSVYLKGKRLKTK